MLCRHQQQFSINVWAGIVGNCLAGLRVLLYQLTGNHYRDFLSLDLPKLLEAVLLAVRARMLYMHDGSPAHFSSAVLDVLNSTYRDRRIGRGGPIAWPPRSPDLNPLEFYLWGHLKTLVYAAPVDNEEALHHRIVDVCQAIRNHPGIFERMRRSMMKRVEASPFSNKSQIKFFQTYEYVDMDIASCFVMWNSCPKFVPTFQLHPVNTLYIQQSWWQ
jgi:hypothetical protein